MIGAGGGELSIVERAPGGRASCATSTGALMAATAASGRGPSLRYDDLGSGEPALLCMTGWCSSRARWTAAALRCSAHRRVLNFDWRGHGDSDPASGDFGTEEMIDDALAVVEAAGVSTFIPCAASHSGWVALELRRRLPERVPKLVSLDWLVTEPSQRYLDVIRQLQTAEGWRDGRATLFGIWAAGDESRAIRDVIAVMERQGAEMWQRSGRVIQSAYARGTCPLEAWSSLEPPAPVLHIYGQPADATYLAAQRDFASTHPWFRVETVPAHTHFAMVECPQEVASVIESFVAG